MPLFIIASGPEFALRHRWMKASGVHRLKASRQYILQGADGKPEITGGHR